MKSVPHHPHATRPLPRATRKCLAQLLLCALTTASALPGQASDDGAVVLPGKRVKGKRPVGKGAELDGGQAVTVMTGRELREHHAELAEALGQLPGVQVLRTGGVGSPALLSLRGSSTEQVAVMLGDAVLDLADGAPLDLSDVPLLGVDRVEIYRGLAPLQVGSQPLGGTLRLTLRRGAGSSGQATAALGSYGTRQAEVGASAGGDWGDSYVGLRLLESTGNFPYLSRGGTAYVGSDDRVRERANNDLHRLGGVLSLQGRWSPDTAWTVHWLGSGLEQGAPGAAVFPALHARYSQNRQILVATASREHLGSLGAQAELALHAVGRWTEVDDTLGEMGFPWRATQRMVGGGAAGLLRLPLITRDDGHLALLGRIGAQATQIQGVELLSHSQRPASQRQSGQASLGALGRLGDWQATLSAGGELAQQQVTDLRQYASSYSLPRQDVLPAWHTALALRWQPQDHWLIDAALRRALRLPNLQEMFGDSATVIGNPQLASEHATAAELGALGKTRAGPVALTGELRGHATWADNLIQLVGMGPHQAMYQNVGQARLLGAEANVAADWSDVHAELRHTTLVTRDQSGRVGYDGKVLPMRPRTRWGGLARWQTGLGSWKTSLWASLDWQAGSFVDAANLVVSPARTLAAAGIRLSTSQPSIFVDLRVDNLSNAAVYDLIGYPLAGRTVWLQLGWRSDGGSP